MINTQVHNYDKRSGSGL